MMRALLPDPVEEGAIAGHFDFGAAEFGGVSALDLAAELRRHRLLAVADAEHRHAGRPNLIRHARGVVGDDRFRPAGEDDRLRRQLGDGIRGVLEGMDFAIDPRFAHPAGDELRHLRAEIDDENLVVRAGDFLMEFLLVHRCSAAKSGIRRSGSAVQWRVGASHPPFQRLTRVRGFEGQLEWTARRRWYQNRSRSTAPGAIRLSELARLFSE